MKRVEDERPARQALRSLAPFAVAALSLLSGCMNLSGIGGGSRYACRAPEGVACQSMSGVYANSVAYRSTSGRPALSATSGKASAGDSRPVSKAARQEENSAPAKTAVQQPPSVGAITTPMQEGLLRSPARILRLWIKPWEDADRDLYDEGYVYVRVDAGQWLIDHAQQRIRDAYAPVRPPRPVAGGATPAPEPTPLRPTLDSARTFPDNSVKPEPQE